jgi:hypothetical protein
MALGAGGKLAGRLFWPAAIAMALYEAYEGYNKDGVKGAILNPLTLGLYSGGAEAAEVPDGEAAPDGGAGAAEGAGSYAAAVAEAEAAGQRIRAAFAIDLSAEGSRMMQTLAAGITAGGASAVAAADGVAARVRAAGSGVVLNTGPAMAPGR